MLKIKTEQKPRKQLNKRNFLGPRQALITKEGIISKAAYYTHQYAPNITYEEFSGILSNPEIRPEALNKYFPQVPLEIKPFRLAQLLKRVRILNPEVPLLNKSKRNSIKKVELTIEAIKRFPKLSDPALEILLTWTYPTERFDEHSINQIRLRYFPELKGNRWGLISKKPLPKLTNEQQKLYDDNLPIIGKAQDFQRRKWHMSEQEFDDFSIESEIALIRGIARYDVTSRKTIKWWIIDLIAHAAQSFRREKVKQGMGISYNRTESILFSLNQLRKGKSLEEIARQRRIPVEELRELIEAYKAWKSQGSFDVVAGRKL